MASVEMIRNEESLTGNGLSNGRDAQIARFEDAKDKCGLGFSGAITGVLVLVKTIIGAALIGVPHAVASSGYALGGILFIVIGVFSAFGCHLLYVVALRLGEAPISFGSVSKKVIPRWAWLIDVAILFQCLGTMCSYLIIVGGSLPNVAHWLGIPDLTRREAVLIGFAFAAPLACMRYLSALRHVIAVAMCVAVWTSLLTCLFYFRVGSAFEPCEHSTDTLPCDGAHWGPFPESFLDFGKNIGVFIFAFSCQMNMFTVCQEVHNMTPRRSNGIIISAHLISGGLLYLAGFFGYATYGMAIRPDVLTSYPAGTVMQVSRMLYFVVVVVSYPIQAHPARQSAMALLRMVKSAGEASLYWSTTAFLLTASLAIPIITSDLGKVYGMIGATSSTMISFIIPGVYYLNVCCSPHAKRYLAFVLVGTGFAIIVVYMVLEFF